MESKSREQFEAVYDAQKHDRFVSNEDWAWKFWQASRAALVVELPSFDGYKEHIVEELQSAFKIACDKAGITVKGEGDER